jgi:H+-transporting ATPase
MKAYVLYRIALCLHMEIYLVVFLVGLNETIRPDLIVFLALFADLATIAVAYDNAHVEPRPVEWQLKKIWLISGILGVLLAAGTAILQQTPLIHDVVKEYGSIQGILFLEIALTQNWLILLTRGWKTWPSMQLLGAIFSVDIIASLFTALGWLTGPGGENDDLLGEQNQGIPPPSWSQGKTDIHTVVAVWVYSACVISVIFIVYWVVNQINWVNNLGRKDRNKRETMMEHVFTELVKVVVESEHDAVTGKVRTTLVNKTAVDNKDD